MAATPDSTKTPAPMMLPVPRKVSSASPRHLCRSPAAEARFRCSSGLLTVNARRPTRSRVLCRKGCSDAKDMAADSQAA